ncbi:MAG: hypothetical protein WA280_17240 [Xanthobacteraceae bacterium]
MACGIIRRFLNVFRLDVPFGSKSPDDGTQWIERGSVNIGLRRKIG